MIFLFVLNILQIKKRFLKINKTYLTIIFSNITSWPWLNQLWNHMNVNKLSYICLRNLIFRSIWLKIIWKLIILSINCSINQTSFYQICLLNFQSIKLNFHQNNDLESDSIFSNFSVKAQSISPIIFSQNFYQKLG